MTPHKLEVFRLVLLICGLFWTNMLFVVSWLHQRKLTTYWKNEYSKMSEVYIDLYEELYPNRKNR